MKITLSATVFILMIVASATMTFAQPPGGGPGGPGGRHGGGPGGQGGGADPGRAVLEALDTDGNHEISGAEMQNAATALSKLDTNGDGKLNQKDLVQVDRHVVSESLDRIDLNAVADLRNLNRCFNRQWNLMPIVMASWTRPSCRNFSVSWDLLLGTVAAVAAVIGQIDPVVLLVRQANSFGLAF